jgi:peptidoglycan/LPS O-acetylase OafA/YrhL
VGGHTKLEGTLAEPTTADVGSPPSPAGPGGAPTEAARPSALRATPGLASIDALRAVAAIGVVLIHVGQVFFIKGVVLRWALIGDVGVSMFFVISGYLITASVISAPRFDRRRYLLQRGARLLPLYYASLAVALLVVDPTPLFSTEGRADVATHLVLLQGLAPGMRYSINGVWWTLTIELLFYLLIAVVGPHLRRRRNVVALGLVMVVIGPVWRVVALAVSEGERTTYLIQQLPGVADLFGAGILLAAALSNPATRLRLGQPAPRWGLLAAGAAAFLASCAWYYEVRLDLWSDELAVVVWPLTMGVAMVGCLAAATVAGEWLERASRWSGLAFLGMVSYGIYLFHPFVMSALAQVWFVEDPSLDAAPYFLGSLAGATVLAAMFHYSIERPPMRWARRVQLRRGVVA